MLKRLTTITVLNSILCECLSADRVYPGFAHTSSSSNDVDAMSVRLLPCEKTGRISTEEGEKGGGKGEVREEILHITTVNIIIYSVYILQCDLVLYWREGRNFYSQYLQNCIFYFDDELSLLSTVLI